ncbi:MAG TPA: hypothetical protein VJS43_16080 [Candidatus Acidoferrales bacterium]|nr:hypothetical protein [Candidatus Acidoferrales bacterium]
MPSRRNIIRTYFLLAAGLAPLLIAGCNETKVHAAVPAPTPQATNARPMTVAPDTDAAPPLEAADIPPEIPQPSSNDIVDLAPSPVVTPPRRAPEREPVENVEQDTTSHPAPRIAPDLSPSDQAAKQKQVEDDSAVATRNLQRVNNMQLSAPQQDLVDHIRGALNDASLAGKSGDWVRAQNLAHIARTLSESLVQSL